MSLDLIKKYRIKAKKSLGQNFLINDKILEDICELINIRDENIVEVWPGYWSLTEKILYKKPLSLNLVEVDKNMVSILDERVRLKELDTEGVCFEIKNEDVLKYNLGESNLSYIYKYSVISNIPYYITSPIIRHFLYDLKKCPEYMVILMQKDVWDRILCQKYSYSFEKKTESSDRKIKSSVLSLMVAKKAYAEEKIKVSPDNFIPKPKVESSVIVFKTHDKYNSLSDEFFLRVVKIWFSSSRKKLIKNLENWGYEKSFLIGVFENIWIDLNSRAEDLDIDYWCRLVWELG